MVSMEQLVFPPRANFRKTYKFIPYEPKVWRKQAKKGKLNLPQGVILGVKKKEGCGLCNGGR